MNAEKTEDKQPIFIVSEDDDDDFFMIEKAIETAGTNNFRIERVMDGEALMALLRKHTNDPQQSMVVLLDLNMPKKDGRQALREIKADESLKKVPILILTTSEAKEDISQSYGLGANAYFIKPSSFREFQDMLRTISAHWFKCAALPFV